eukprot:CAMPEP_0170631260 /NCGR_PEP_ID=MMETSP0224-20130122/34519_1 /TAXON_ID=285029 /ORGANISM="Togula jolla, Strain CCCM 725" /LENGTH=294 /DNA_ID=CAMNT_0010959533 /DNA_START=1 /DNA_END=882 /DNA_ORIENTATION=-
MEFSSGRVTPLHSLVTGFASSHSTSMLPEVTMTRACLLLDLLRAIPASADLSNWVRSPTADEKFLQVPESPLSILSCGHMFQHHPQQGVEALKLLCDRGVSPNAFAGSPPALHTLVEQLGSRLCSSPLVHTLLPMTDLSALMPSGHTLLTRILITQLKSVHHAGTRESVQILLRARCDPDIPEAVEKGQQQSPLHIAATLRDDGLVEDLVEARADPCRVDGNRRSPLHIAVACAPTGATANFNVEEILIQARADVSQQDRLGLTPLHYAFLKNDVGALDFDGQWLEESGEEHLK